MRSYVLLGAIYCLCQLPATAQDTISSTGQSLQGTWMGVTTLPSGDVVPIEVGDFSADGSYTGANMDSTHSVHKGVWVRVGDRQFAFTVMFFTHDATGAVNGIVKARALVTLAEDLKSYDAVVERVVMDTSGKELQTISGIRGHSVRMGVELPKSPSQ